ncbi:MAG: hypothetical protein ACREOO_09175 [bacterium]
MKEAAALEYSVDKHPVTPSSVLPARELHGNMLLTLGKTAEAERAFEACLRISPNRFSSLSGAGRAAELAGAKERAITYYTKLVEVSSEADAETLPLVQARQFLAEN